MEDTSRDGDKFFQMDNDMPRTQYGVSGINGKIFLVGMPAVGKTYWGMRLAEAYSFPFVDLDVMIAEQERASVQALFATYGEHGFREREHKYLGQVIADKGMPAIVACGGGTPCFFDNMQLMKAAGRVIYLQADTTTLLEHIGKSDEVRPLLRGRGDIEAYLDALLAKRKMFYEQAHYILPSGDISLATFAKIISDV